ncbi:MAG: hypothetical protein K6B15_00155 [Parasporobacterium sp.]|nr:hypothetical protein [Parasporobacterium sp.]
MPAKVVKKAEKSKKKWIKKFGDDSARNYSVEITENPQIGNELGVKNIRIADKEDGLNTAEFDRQKGIIVGNIRMGFGHYRISMAIASAAHHLGYTPYWMDLNSFPTTTCTKLIGAQNELYSKGSRLSQKSKLFNKLVWEPLNYEGFKKLSYNAADQKNAELMSTVYKNIPKDIPVVATHVWPAQAAIHAGMENVVNAIPDNWPMALHYSEGSIHTVQTHYAYNGYRRLDDMVKNTVLKPMPEDELVYTGHYIDHELVSNIEADCDARIRRRKNKKPIRFLLTIGGAGAQKEIFIEIIKHLIKLVNDGQATLFVNVGDYRNVWEEIVADMFNLRSVATEHFDNWEETKKFAEEALNNDDLTGFHVFCHKDIFEAVYATNLLMRACDVLVTKPSELAFYPVPKLFIKRVGGHEMWGAIHSAEIGDGTTECDTIPKTKKMLDLFLKEENVLINMCENIKQNKAVGIYDGAYKVVELAFNNRKE